MGNGMPIAAAVMRPEVIEEFGREVRYFNTFGGNAVSIAAAQAVLDVIRDEGLQANAAQVGALLKAMLAELAARHPAVGDVRGAGLFVGIELVRPGGREPRRGPRAAGRQRHARRHVLMGTAGLHNNVAEGPAAARLLARRCRAVRDRARRDAGRGRLT